MAIQLPDARQLSDEVLEALRLRALRGCEMGLTEADVADLLGVTRETVSRWWSAYRATGLPGLPGDRTGRPLGSGRFLTDEQAAHIRDLIDHNSPEKLGVASPLWTRQAVRELIKKEYGIDMAVRTVGLYLRRWGYTPKKPRRHARRQDPKEVREWLEETYPEIEERARQEDAEIHFCDEAGVAAGVFPGRGYAEKGEPATMEGPDPHIRVNVVSTVSNTGEMHFMTYAGSMNGQRFIDFLERLLAQSSRKVLIVTDRLRAHDCDEVWDWIDDHADRIDMYFLPRRSPEMNPVEYLNHDIKANLHSGGLPDSKGELNSRLQAFLDKLRGIPEHIMSYFRHPCVQYAAAPM